MSRIRVDEIESWTVTALGAIPGELRDPPDFLGSVHFV